MRRCLFFLPLLGLAPLGHFLGSYLGGAGILSGGIGFLVSAASMFILPWVISALFVTIAKTAWPIRISLFIFTFVVQAILLVMVVPAGATSEMMGIAHRLRREFPPDRIRDCADHLRQKHRDGTLAVKVGDKGHNFLMSTSAVIVDDSELPASLRGRFDCVFIQQGRVTDDEQVVFALPERTGIICDSRKHVSEFFVYSIADGVHAYRYQRL